jgi:hypothetical protein
MGDRPGIFDMGKTTLPNMAMHSNAPQQLQQRPGKETNSPNALLDISRAGQGPAAAWEGGPHCLLQPHQA